MKHERRSSWVAFDRGFLRWYGILFGAIVILLVILVYMNSRLERIQNQLAFTPSGGAHTERVPLPEEIAAGQRIYVPIYSHVYSGGGTPHLLEGTLSIRNTDGDAAITITAVKYYGTAGDLVRDYLQNPMRLAPLATTEFLVEQQDTTGGSGANFIVEWVAEEVVNEPIVEAVMVGLDRGNSISFIRPGVAIR